MIGQFIKSLMKLIENDIISLNIYSKFFFLTLLMQRMTLTFLY